MPDSDEIDLRLTPTEQLMPHEETVQRLSDRLSSRMIREGVQRDPIIVDLESKTVLDGTHRLDALKRIGVARAVCDMVDYNSEDVRLLRWFRFVEDPGEERARSIMRRVGATTEIEFGWNDPDSLTQVMVTYRGRAFSHGGNSKVDTILEVTRRFDEAVTRSGLGVSFVEENAASPELLRGGHMALLTPRIAKGDVLNAARNGELFPPKTTLHVLPVRPVGLNYPIEALRSGDDMLARILSGRRRRKIAPPSFYEGRLYREPVVVFE